MTTTEAALRDALKDIAKGVFIDAATQTHYSWIDGTNGREPDFGEAASDYAESFADAYVEQIAALSQPSPASSTAEVRLWPDIGPDPMKGPREPDQNEKAISRVEQAYVIQQKEVPDQTALVWRWDIGRLLMDYRRLRAWQDSQREKAIDPNVRKLVIAAREAWEVNCVSGDDLDKALEPFAALVPYENEPDRDAPSPSSGEPAPNAGNIMVNGEEYVPIEAYREAMSGWKAANQRSGEPVKQIEDGHADTEGEAAEAWAHLNCPTCGGSGHIEDAHGKVSGEPASVAGEVWKCGACANSLPEPQDCGWPTCGCDPYAQKVLDSLL